jgi:diphthine methyl ester synthase
MPFFTPSWKPSSWYDRLAENVVLGLHSLVLLDIKVKEPDLDVLARKGKVVYEPPRFMTVAQCCAQMSEVESERDGGVCGRDRLVVGAARVGSSEMSLVAGTVREIADVDLGRPLHSVVLVGQRCHDVEREVMRTYAVDKETFDEAWKKGEYGKS